MDTGPADQYIFQFFEQLPRQGPGSSEQTVKALDLIRDNLPQMANILDIGCGNGAQTSVLVKELPAAYITAIDIYRPFLLNLQSAIREISQLTSTVFPCQASMTDLPFKANCFDLIWSEGAIYVAGFENGLNLWKNLIVPNGFLVLTEVSWLSNTQPQAVRDFWQKEYPGIRTISENKNIIRMGGYKLLENFTLPRSCWQDNYYQPAKDVIRSELDRTSDRIKVDFLQNMTAEIENYEKYSEHYGYVFYIMQYTDD